MTISSTTSNMSNPSSSSGTGTSMLIPPRLSVDQDRAMSLRILALLASTSLLAAHVATDGKGKEPSCCDESGHGEDPLGGEVRLQSDDWARHTGPKVCRSALLREPHRGESGQGQSDRIKCPWQLGRMPPVPDPPVIHPSLGSPCAVSKERPTSLRHHRNDQQGQRERGSLQPEAQRPICGSGCCRNVSYEEVGTRAGNERDMAKAAEGGRQEHSEFEGAVRGATKTSDSNASGFRRDGHYTWKKDSEARTTSTKNLEYETRDSQSWSLAGTPPSGSP